MSSAHNHIIILSGLPHAGKVTAAGAFRDFYGTDFHPRFLTICTSRPLRDNELNLSAAQGQTPGAVRHVTEEELQDPSRFFGLVEKCDGLYAFDRDEVRQWFNDKDSAILIGVYYAPDPADDFRTFQEELTFIVEEETQRTEARHEPAIHWMLLNASPEECTERIRQQAGISDDKKEKKIKKLLTDYQAIQLLCRQGRFHRIIENHGIEPLTEEQRLSLANEVMKAVKGE